MKFKKAMAILLCSGLFLTACSQESSSDATENIQDIEEVAEVEEVEEVAEIEEVEEVQEVKEIDLSGSLSVIGDEKGKTISIEQGEAFAEAINSLGEKPSKAIFVDGAMLLYTYNEISLSDGSKVEDPTISIVQWDNGQVKISSQIDENYITDLALNNGIYSVVYQKDLRRITDIPNGLSYFRLGFENGILQDTPEFYSITFTNANADPLSLTNGATSYMTWESVFESSLNLDLVTNMISYDDFYNGIKSTSESTYEPTHYKIENSTITPYSKENQSFNKKSDIDSSIVDLTNTNSSYWNDINLVLNVLTSKGEIVEEVKEEVVETVNEVTEAELIEMYSKVFDVYAKIREMGYSNAESISQEAGMWSYNLILDDIRYSSTVARYYLDKSNNNYSQMRYDFVDINGDGMKELFILSEATDGYDGIWGIYSIHNGNVVPVLFAEERTHLALTSNLDLLEYGSGGHDSGNVSEFKLENGVVDCLIYVGYNGTEVYTSPFENGELVYGETTPIDSSEKDRLLGMAMGNDQYKFNSKPLSDIIK